MRSIFPSWHGLFPTAQASHSVFPNTRTCRTLNFPGRSHPCTPQATSALLLDPQNQMRHKPSRPRGAPCTRINLGLSQVNPKAVDLLFFYPSCLPASCWAHPCGPSSSQESFLKEDGWMLSPARQQGPSTAWSREAEAFTS